MVESVIITMVCNSLRTIYTRLEACLLTMRFVESPQSGQAAKIQAKKASNIDLVTLYPRVI